MKECPFCGNDSFSDHDLQSVRIVEKELKVGAYGLKLDRPETIYFVKCGRCGGRGGSGRAFYSGLTKKTVTKDQAKQYAIEKWNNRG